MPYHLLKLADLLAEWRLCAFAAGGGALDGETLYRQARSRAFSIVDAGRCQAFACRGKRRADDARHRGRRRSLGRVSRARASTHSASAIGARAFDDRPFGREPSRREKPIVFELPQRRTGGVAGTRRAKTDRPPNQDSRRAADRNAGRACAGVRRAFAPMAIARNQAHAAGYRRPCSCEPPVVTRMMNKLSAGRARLSA